MSEIHKLSIEITPRYEMFYCGHRADFLEVRVVVNGIEEQVRSRIFQKSYRADDFRSKFELLMEMATREITQAVKSNEGSNDQHSADKL